MNKFLNDFCTASYPLVVKLLTRAGMSISVALTVRWFYRRCKQNLEIQDFVPPSMELDTFDVRAKLNSYKEYLLMRGRLLRIAIRRPVTVADYSMMIEQHVTRYPDLRSQLINLKEQVECYMPKNGSHPEAAMFRRAVSEYLTTVVHKAGYTPYYVSRASSDQFDGSRYFYHTKDLSQEFRHDPVTDNHCILMVDVDYFADMKAWLRLMRPILMYSFVPTRISARRSEYSYNISDGQVHYYVQGGGEYHHGLWSYMGDIVEVDFDDGSLGVFNLEQRAIPGDPDHRMIFLIPIAHVPWPASTLVPRSGAVLQRRDLTSGYFFDPITDEVSVSCGTYSVELPGILYRSIYERLCNKKDAPIVADVERMLRDSSIPNFQIVAPLLFNSLNVPFKVNVIKTSLMTSNYHPLTEKSLVSEDGKPMGESASSALVYPGACFPTNSESSELSTIKGRVEKPKNGVIPPKIYKQYASEFVTSFVRVVHQGVPWQIAQVKEKQNEPLQKARIEQIEAIVTTNSSNRLAAFVKAEPYATPNDPRNITTMAPSCTLMMSCYTYAFKNDVLKHTPFYAPGLTPQETCTRLATLSTDGVVTTDYSRFDGSVSKWLQQNIVQAAYLRWVKTGSFTKEFIHWFDLVFMQRAQTKAGVQYDPGYGTRSGSPITTDANTMINAFIVFVALRMLKFSVKESINKLGVYCGDDGYTPFTEGLIEMLTLVSKDLGLTLEAETRKSGPYSFLGRKFIDPVLIPDSYQDMKRTLCKLHLVRNGPESLEQRLANKAAGYLVTDPVTPLLSHWAKRVLAITSKDAKNQTHEEAYKMEHPWPQYDIDRITESVCADLGIDRIELQAKIDLINAVQSLDDFPVLFEWAEPTKVDCVRSGDLMVTGAHIEVIKQQNAEATKQAINAQTLAQSGPKPKGKPKRKPKPKGPKSGCSRPDAKRGAAVNELSTVATPSAGSCGKHSNGPSGKAPPFHRKPTKNGHPNGKPKQRSNTNGPTSVSRGPAGHSSSNNNGSQP